MRSPNERRDTVRTVPEWPPTGIRAEADGNRTRQAGDTHLNGFEGGRPASTAVRQGPATCALSCTDARSVRPAYGPIRAVPAPFGRKLVESAGPTRALRLQLSAPSTTRSRWAPARVSPSIIGWTYTLNASAPPSL